MMKRSNFLFAILMACMALIGCDSDPNTYAKIETEHGNMIIQLNESTPRHRDNFVKLAEQGYYDSLLFHRVIQGFMVQGGDPESKDSPSGQPLGGGGPGYTVDHEIGDKHFYGAVAAARQGDQVNPEKKSSGSQFYIVQGVPQSQFAMEQLAIKKGIEYTEEEIQRYINEGGTPMLDGDYTVFGHVIEGKETIDKIAAVSVDQRSRPMEPVRMIITIHDTKPEL